MPHMIPSEGRSAGLAAYVSRPIEVRLFTNAVKPSLKLTAKSFREPPPDVGYARGLVAPEAWTIEGDVATATPLAFRFTAKAGRIYGAVFVRDGQVLWVYWLPEDEPFTARREGYELRITPRVRWRTRAA